MLMTHKFAVTSQLTRMFWIQRCLGDIQLWMEPNKFKLNHAETELIVFGTQSLRENMNPLLPSQIIQQKFEAANIVRNLGVMFDSDLSL